MTVHRRIARKVRAQAERQANQTRTAHAGEVIDTGPIAVELFDSRHVLEVGDGLRLSQWVRQYDLKYTIDVGDVLLVDRRGDDWIAVDVLADKSLTL